MAKAKFRVFFDNAPASVEQLARFTEIRIDQAIGMAAEAELDWPVGTSAQGVWKGAEEDWARVRVEVKVADADFVPLIDGPVIGNRYELSAQPDQSHVTLVVQDDSVLLNRDERVQLFEDMAAQDIVSSVYAEAGLTPDVDATPDAGAALQRVVVQRGTGMQLLRDLARRLGMFAYVKPGEAPGLSIGAFKRLQLAPGTLPELLLVGDKRNVAKFSAQYDALRPLASQAGSVALADRSVLAGNADASSQLPLGDLSAHDVAAHDLATPGIALLSGTREEQADLDAATAAAVDLSSWAWAASGELDVDDYAGVLQPYEVIRVRGVGGFLSGDYLVGRVTHVLSDSAYRQRFSLHRNARSAGSGGGGAGGLPGGIF
jgi:phage protein D